MVWRLYHSIKNYQVEQQSKAMHPFASPIPVLLLIPFLIIQRSISISK